MDPKRVENVPQVSTDEAKHRPKGHFTGDVYKIENSCFSGRSFRKVDIFD